MKVAVLSRVAYPLHGFGGLERHVGSLVRHLAQKNVAVTLYTTPPEQEAVELSGVSLRPVPYRIIPWPRRAGFVVADRITNYLVWSLRAGLRAAIERPDIVQAEAGGGFGYAWHREPSGPPLVLHPHGMEEFKAGWLKRTSYLPLRSAVRYAARRAERVLVPDRAMVDEVHRHLSVRSSQSVVLPNAVDLEEIDRPVPRAVCESVIERWDLAEGFTVILSVGRLESNKGFALLAEALAQVKETLPPRWLWVLVGSGPEESHLRRKVRELGLQDNTRFTANISDQELAALYRRADLFVHPTLYEGSSQVTLEAMAYARPVVATAVGGIPDKVKDGITGFLVPPGDTGALGRALVKAFSLGRPLAALGAEGRRRVEAEFSWSERARRLVDLYREILSEARDRN